MYVGVVFQKTAPTAKEAAYQYAFSQNDKETMESVAGRAEQLAENLRRQYPTYLYRTLVGELTHEIEPPKPPVVKVKPLRAIKEK